MSEKSLRQFNFRISSKWKIEFYFNQNSHNSSVINDYPLIFFDVSVINKACNEEQFFKLTRMKSIEGVEGDA